MPLKFSMWMRLSLLPPKHRSVVEEKAHKLNAVIGHAAAILIFFALGSLPYEYRALDCFIGLVAPATIPIRPSAEGLSTELSFERNTSASPYLVPSNVFTKPLFSWLEICCNSHYHTHESTSRSPSPPRFLQAPPSPEFSQSASGLSRVPAIFSM